MNDTTFILVALAAAFAVSAGAMLYIVYRMAVRLEQ